MSRRRRQADPSREESPAPPRRAGHHLAVLYPGPYEESASSLGVHAVLGALRARPGFSAGRVLEPSGEGPPRCIEERIPLAEMPVVLVSAAWELQVGALVETLRRAGIPPLASRRDGTSPLVVAGGALALSNAALIEPVADVVIRGDGEQAITTILDLVGAGTDRESLLAALGALQGARPGTRARAEDGFAPARSAFTTPRAALPSMHLVEVMRGCPHACAFCVMSRTRTGARPRFVPAARVLEAVPGDVRRVGLVGPSVLDHPGIVPILEALVERGLEVGISSVRAPRLDDEKASLLGRLGLRTLTVALDGPSARIRDAIEKRVSSDQVLRAARLGRAHGIPRLKLYVMLGFEDETDEDVEELLDTCRELAGRTSLSISLGPVVPKRGTGLENMPFVERAAYESRVKALKRALPAIPIDAVPWKEARLEARLARMDASAMAGILADHDSRRPFRIRRLPH